MHMSPRDRLGAFFMRGQILDPEPREICPPASTVTGDPDGPLTWRLALQRASCSAGAGVNFSALAAETLPHVSELTALSVHLPTQLDRSMWCARYSRKV